ncbi:TIGR02680 family protein [Nonomuraea typhae]|uniref:TIGR02680 family protein n=1 Tax=Nonomuraea typhae TaxID=2603600 RepID=UPI0012F7BFC0|nr:TIGR02680 family protein [Nonomuraea typhae]
MTPEQWLAAARTGGAPEPARRRWQPLRVGVVNLWEYDDAEFWFADGRLVLRGGNGTGKTKILELTTFMLLRGEISPSVLDPFGSRHRTMRYNLLPSGEEDDPRPAADTGLGYAWAEFGRLDEHGQPRFVVCGLGASARRGSGTEATRRWLFITGRRVGADLVLAPPAGPLDEKELRKAEHVQVFESAESYRQELSRRLFGLDRGAYDNLTELLKQLRRPKLGERLNPRELERTLRDALPELATAEVTQLVDGWDRLEQLRTGVEQLEEAATQVASFVRRSWLPWVRALVRARADRLTSATTQLDNTTRDRKKAEEDLRSARDECRENEQAHRLTKRTLAERRVEVRELIESQAYQEAAGAAHRVEGLRRAADREQEAAAQAKKTLDSAEKARGKAETVLRSVSAKAREAKRAVDDRARAVREKAGTAGLQRAADAHLPSDVDALRSAHAGRVERLGHLTELRTRWESAERETDRAGGVVKLREEEESDAEKEAGAAEDAARDLIGELESRLEAWIAALTETPGDDLLLRWRAAVRALATPDAQRPASLADALAAYVSEAENLLRDQREDLRGERRPLEERRQAAEAERATVSAAVEAPPPGPALWRRREREAVPGSPLWRCVDPGPALGLDALAGLEATLAAAGLLDAWVMADGRLVLDEADVFLLEGETHPASLADILEPVAGAGLSTDRVASVLAGIGWYTERPEAASESSAWLAADGTWRMGPLTGRAEPRGPASYLGAAARERARQRRLRDLQKELAGLSRDLATIDGWLEEVAAALDGLARARHAVPRSEEQAVRDAVARVAAASRAHGTAVANLEKAAGEHTEAIKRQDRARARASDYAAAHAFPLDQLAEVRLALDAYLTGVERLDGALILLRAEEEYETGARDALEEAADAQADAETEVGRRQAKAWEAAVRAKAAAASLSADARTQLLRKDDLDQAVERLQGETDRLSDTVTELKIKESRAQSVLDAHETARNQAEKARDTASAAWWRAADDGLAAVLRLTVPQSRAVKPTLEAAIEARKKLAPAGADDVERSWRRCYEGLQEARQRLLPTRDLHVREDDDEDTLPAVEVLIDSVNGWLRPDRAAAALADQVRTQRETFDSEQQRVLTRLLGSTFIEHLKERLDYTESVFTRINDCLAHHPTRQGHTLRLRWDADSADAAAGQVVEALRQGYEHLAEDRQDMVRAFLRHRIEQAREDAAAEGVADWQEHLAAALDYRRWLRVSLEFRPAAGARWRPFDAARHGSKSGGEKVVLLSQPLFAAAVVAYDAAAPEAPRVIWLDEAMTGIDGEVKAGFMGLTVELDLDVMLTAHDEWCRYASVPAAAVYDLSRQRYVPGVDAMPYLWCGRTWTQLDGTMVARAGQEDEAGQMDGGLF